MTADYIPLVFKQRIGIKDNVYRQLEMESAKQDKSISELVDQALVKYLQNAFLIKPAKPQKSIKSRPKKLKPYNWDKSNNYCLQLEKRIGIYDNVYRLLEQESQRTGKSIQRIATNAFIQYLENVNSQTYTSSS